MGSLDLPTLSIASKAFIGLTILISIAIVAIFFDGSSNNTGDDLPASTEAPITRYYDDYQPKENLHLVYKKESPSGENPITLEDLKALKQKLDDLPHPNKSPFCSHEGEKADVTEWAAVGCEKVVTYCLDCYQPIDKRTDC